MNNLSINQEITFLYTPPKPALAQLLPQLLEGTNCQYTHITLPRLNLTLRCALEMHRKKIITQELADFILASALSKKLAKIKKFIL